MTEYRGNYQGKNLKVGIVVARFNDFVTDRLLKGALDTLKLNGVLEQDIDIAYVPGAFEVPLTVQTMAESNKYDGMIALGAVIRGETPHFDYICSATANGILQVNLKTEVPTMFGILTTDTVEQAMGRAGFKSGNKGSDCAASLIETVNLRNKLSSTPN